jgi:hypothetical protein
MTRKAVVGIGILTFLSVALSSATADVRRERTQRRPDVLEIGDPYPISLRILGREASHITEMRSYVATYGPPDYAEIQEVAPQWPWESYEVRLYYMRRNLETDFGHAFVSPTLPNFGVLKYQSDIPPDKRHQIEIILQARQEPAPAPAPQPVARPAVQPEPEDARMEALVARIEAAAARAEQAANKAAEDSEAAVRAADRTSTILETLSESPPPSTPAHRARQHR